MEGHSALCCSTEVIESVAAKLREIMKISPMDLQQDLKGLTDDLEKISVSRERNLNKISDLITDEQVKVWVKQVEELIYEFEDWKLESKDGTSSSIGEPERSWQISKFTALINGARERYTRYEIHKKALATDPHLVYARDREASIHAPSRKTEGTADSSQLWGKRAVLVGIDEHDGPKIELIQNHLKDKTTTLTVVSIVGVRGIGKSTLAKAIYGDLKDQFNCQASVFLGPNPCVKAILLDILHQLKPPKDHGENHGHVREVVVQLYEFLRDKRYLILVDDIQSTWAWKVISCAFPENGQGNRILVTTHFNDVADLCSAYPSDLVYRMKALSPENSKKLLDNIICIHKKERPTDFEEVSDRVLKLCCGIPLAIIVTAGLLSRNWSVHGKYQFPQLGHQAYSTSELMRKVLDISFADLSSLQVKYCFLFLSSFPVNCTINKAHLIRRWVTEGLVKEGSGKGLWETGESYFNELIHKRLIEPVFDYNDDQAVGCTIHAVVYEFIASLARQDNFVTDASELVCGPFPCDTIRRYSVHYIGKKDEADTLVTSTMHLSRVRCLTVFGGGRVSYDSLTEFKLVRVLDLKDTKFEGSSLSLTLLGCLTLLQYLALGRQMPAGSCHIDLEEGFYKHLETLDVSGIQRARFPDSIYTLPKLVAIIGDIVELPVYYGEPNGMLNWEEVPTITVTYWDVDYHRDRLILLFKSERLRKLSVSLDSTYISEEKVKLFFTWLGECKAQSLLLDFEYMPVGWLPSPSLRRFVLKRSITSFPDTWPSSLVNLTHLDIQILEVGAQDIVHIGRLPKLNFLKLYSLRYDPKERLLIFGGFRNLKVAWFKCPEGGMGLQFENRNTMPELRRLRLDFNEKKTRDLYGRSFDFGLRFASRLIEVNVTINCKGSTPWDVSYAESAIREQLRDHINKPNYQFRREEENPSDNEAAVASSSKASTSK